VREVEHFDERYPNVAAWVRDGWIEIGRDEYSRSFIRVLDIGGLVWEGEEEYENVDEALSASEVEISARLEENT